VLEQDFSAYGDVLEMVEVFKYLGRLLAFDDNDIQAVQKCCSWISNVLRAENVVPMSRQTPLLGISLLALRGFPQLRDTP